MFGQFVCNALGVPAIGVGQPAHCCFAARCDYPETEPQAGSVWKVYQGRGWQFSDCGGCYGPQFVEQETRKYRTAEAALLKRLQWLAAALTAKERADAAQALAARVPQPVNTQHPLGVPADAVDVVLFGRRTPADPAHKEAVLNYNAEGPGAKTDASNTAGRPPRVPEPPIQAPPGVIHVEAENFTKAFADPMYPNEQEGRVFVFDCWTGGKQIYFQRNMKVSWAEYEVDAPAAGTYALGVMLAAANRNQVLEISRDGTLLGTVKLPGTTGLWQRMAPVDIQLKAGRQTLRIASPGNQRGISIRWFELTPKPA